jgi:methylmalonyl-CoA epimerase
MGLKKIDHIGIAVKDLEASKLFYEGSLGIKASHEEVLGDMKIAFIPVGEVNVELIQCISDDGVIAKFISKKGEGIHHIAYEVDDIAGMLGRMNEQGVKLVDKEPRKGAHGKMVAFLHPKSTNGVLTEFVSKKDN